jgi:DNA-binding PadR family transcriptional regulator
MNDRKTSRAKADFSGCACSGAHLPKLVQPLLLAALAREPLHGYAIAQRIARADACPGAPPDHSGVYRLLRGMERRGLLTSKLAESEAGPARREYALTARGRACLARWADSLARYRGTIDAVLALCRG